ncbi:MAG: LytTR family transcriptional regulator DNA-binding domain-containing protein, partial [Defluviitaleaceae bacterium]|nr:LytTR family transcriptional regulator DNA-binding domain-containing protein [Defluviitaleaceae bacterium]
IKTYLLIAEARRGDFSYKVGHNTFKAQIKDIIYMRSQWRKVTMFLADGSSVEFYGNLKEIYEQQLQHFDFISTHVSYLVNYDYIAGIKADKLELTTGAEPLPISKTKSKDVWEAYVAIMDKRRV